MDDAAFQQWSDALTAMRADRQQSIEEQLKSKADAFSPAEFFDLAAASLEKIMEKWFSYEQQSFESNPPENVAEALENTNGEMESIVDFEVEALTRDMTDIQSRITWDQTDVAAAEPAYRTFVDELRKRYQIKLKALGSGQKKRALPAGPEPVVYRASGSSSHSSGVGLFLMFAVGLLLGGGPSVYFLDVSKKLDKKFQEERSKMLADQRALADGMTILHDSFEKLATGKALNIVELEKKTRQIEIGVETRTHEIEKTYARERERTLKKIPAGVRLDKALSDLEASEKSQIEALKSQEYSEAEPWRKQKRMLQELLAH